MYTGDKILSIMHLIFTEMDHSQMLNGKRFQRYNAIDTKIATALSKSLYFYFNIRLLLVDIGVSGSLN